MSMNFIYHDGGRVEAGYQKTSRDCVVRAAAIATERPYVEIVELISKFAALERRGKRKRTISHPLKGVHTTTMRKLMAYLDWVWVPTMQIGQECRVHLKANELPEGRLVVRVSRHATCVIDGVIFDTYDPSRGGTRCVYGYFYNPHS